MEEITFAELKELFKETREMIRELSKANAELSKANAELSKSSAEASKETDKKFQETDRMIKEISAELGGIGRSNGQIAEDFFYTALANTMQINNLKFDFIDRNTIRKRNNTAAEYDIIMYNDYKVLIVEVKHNFKYNYLRDFYNRIKKFRILYHEYKNYKIYAAIAAMTFENDALKEAKEYGFYILTQNNQNIQILNPTDFEPTEFK